MAKNTVKTYVIIVLIVMVSASSWAETYYVRSTGTAANKEAASGPCTTLTNCMNKGVYVGETFADGDVIVRCHTLIEDGLDEVFLNLRRTISISANSYLKTSDGEFYLTSGGEKYIVK